MGQSQSGHNRVASKDFKPRSYLVSCCKQVVPSQRPGLQPYVPPAAVEEILLNLPAHRVVRVCRLVCHEWKELVDSAAHWKERCRREGIKPLDASRPPDDWRSFYFLTKKRRNLIKNPKGEEIWLKEQLIDLQKEGYNAAFMDQVQPHIRISDWYSPWNDCGRVYEIRVELLDQKKEPINVFGSGPIIPESVEWCEMTHVFKDYGPGVRFIYFTHGGKNTGSFGVRVTNSTVEICPAEER